MATYNGDGHRGREDGYLRYNIASPTPGSAVQCMIKEAAMWLLLTLSLIARASALSIESTNSKGTQRQEPVSLDLLAERFMAELDARSSDECSKSAFATWDHQTNVTEENQKKKLAANLEASAWRKQSWKLMQTWKDHVPLLTDESLLRRFELLSVLGSAALPVDELEKLNQVVSDMETIYSKAKICDYIDPEKCDLSLNPDIQGILRSSKNYSELTHVWKEWRDNSGKKMRGLYKEYVRLGNKAANLNDRDNMGDMWTYSYNPDGEAFRRDMEDTHKQLKPLYQQLHAYIRRKLREVYGPEVVTERGPIPAHLFGDMWAQGWDNIYELVVPYPNKTSIDVTDEMQRQNYTPKKMVKMADDFFASLNLTRVPDAFWKDAIIEKPTDRDIVCHASASDFCNGKDFRIKMCTEVNMRDFITVHHEMGHVQYFLQYKDLPAVYRTGANPGFHEAVGDVLAISVSTPKHLHKIGLLDKVEDDAESDINFLLSQALSIVGFLPFGYLVDLWRWNVFSGKTAEKDWNCAWWDLRYELQGVKPPVIRTEKDFDPGAKYHVPVSVGYIRYFVAHVLQFQFHKALCLKAGEYDPLDPNKPLHKCDIYESTEAGKVLGDMLKLGRSKPWSEAMTVITGQSKMDATVIREYFKPLEDWLIQDNLDHQEFIGWRPDGEYCVYNTPTPNKYTCPHTSGLF